MSRPFLSLRLPQDDVDGDISFELCASNGSVKTALSFWGTQGEFIQFGTELMAFPRDVNHQVSYVLGDDELTWAYYLALRAFCVDSVGHAALEIKTAIPGAPPRAYHCEFFIAAEPASLNKLGQLLIDLANGKTATVDWEPNAL